MQKYREYIGWGSIVIAALGFLPIPLPNLPPTLSSYTFALIPGIGRILLSLVPMLLFAAGIGLIKGWDGGRKLFFVYAVLATLAALAGVQYNPVFAALDLTVLAACLAVVLWGDWRRLLPRPPSR